MSLDLEILAERIAAVERHLKRVAACLPMKSAEFIPGTDASDAVILHLWQAVQLIIDIATASCVHMKLGSPSSYANAFFKLSEAALIPQELATRLAHAAGFRNRIVHAYEELDMQKIYKIAKEGPPDLRAFLAKIRDVLAQ